MFYCHFDMTHSLILLSSFEPTHCSVGVDDLLWLLPPLPSVRRTEILGAEPIIITVTGGYTVEYVSYLKMWE